MSLMRLSVKKAAHAELSRAAYRKSRGKPHEVGQRQQTSQEILARQPPGFLTRVQPKVEADPPSYRRQRTVAQTTGNVKRSPLKKRRTRIALIFHPFQQPAFSPMPMPLHRSWRDLQHGADLLDGESTEVA
jgi:hypothetical protein